jgi:hypothetical protein
MMQNIDTLDISPAVQKAFAEWQDVEAVYQACSRTSEKTLDQFNAMIPEKETWNRPFNADQQAKVQAAFEMSGHNAAEDAASLAFNEAHKAFLRFLKTEPKTMGDVRLQAKHLSAWLEDCAVEEPTSIWLGALAQGEAA